MTAITAPAAHKPVISHLIKPVPMPITITAIAAQLETMTMAVTQAQQTIITTM